MDSLTPNQQHPRAKAISLAVCIDGEWFERIIAPKTQSDETKRAISQSVAAYHEAKPFKSRKRLKKLKTRKQKAALKEPMGADDDRFSDHPLVESWLSLLRSVPPNTYTTRIKPIEDKIFDQSPKSFYLERLPCHRTYLKGLRFYSEWTSISKFKRHLIFNGDLDIDIKSFHFNLFLGLCRKQFDKIDQETGEVFPNKLDQILQNRTLNDYFSEFGWQKWLWKPLLNATIHGLAPEKLRMAVAEFATVEAVPQIFQAITKYLYVLQTQDIESGLGGAFKFRYGLWTNKVNWTLLFNSWELRIKTSLSKIPSCYGRVSLDSHDGFVFCLSKHRYRPFVEKKLKSNMMGFNLQNGFSFELSIETIHPMDFSEIENKKKSEEVTSFLKSLSVNEPESQEQGNRWNVDELIRSGLEDFRLGESYRKDWKDFKEREEEPIPLVILGT